MQERFTSAVEIDHPITEFGRLANPMLDDFEVERLGPNTIGLDSCGAIVRKHPIRQDEVRADARPLFWPRRLELGRHVDTKRIEERNALAMRHQGPATRRATPRQVILHGRGRRIDRTHAAAQGLELLGRQRRRTTARMGRGSIVARRRKWNITRFRDGRVQDIGRLVQVAHVVPANQLSVARGHHVAFDDASAHARRGDVSLPGVFGVAQRRASMRDRIPTGRVWPFAGCQRRPKRPRLEPAGE